MYKSKALASIPNTKATTTKKKIAWSINLLSVAMTDYYSNTVELRARRPVQGHPLLQNKLAKISRPAWAN